MTNRLFLALLPARVSFTENLQAELLMSAGLTTSSNYV